MDSIYEIISEFHSNYMEAKREKNLLDFNDLEHFTIEVLKNDEVAKAYKNQLSIYSSMNIKIQTLFRKPSSTELNEMITSFLWGMSSRAYTGLDWQTQPCS